MSGNNAASALKSMRILEVAPAWAALLICICGFAGSNLRPDADYTEGFVRHCSASR
jgi:hypothetical protein